MTYFRVAALRRREPQIISGRHLAQSAGGVATTKALGGKAAKAVWRQSMVAKHGELWQTLGRRYPMSVRCGSPCHG